MKAKGVTTFEIEAASLSREIVDAAEAVFGRGRVLAAVAEAAADSVGGVPSDISAQALFGRVARLRSASLHGMSVILELQAQAAHLERLAWVREHEESARILAVAGVRRR